MQKRSFDCSAAVRPEIAEGCRLDLVAIGVIGPTWIAGRAGHLIDTIWIGRDRQPVCRLQLVNVGEIVHPHPV
jgi:hypothetical protein